METKASVLNRDIELVDGVGLTVTADPRHVQVMVETMGCSTLKPLLVPMERGKHESDDDKEPTISELKSAGMLAKKTGNADTELSPGDVTRFRAVAARANYLSTNRDGIAYSVNDICRRMGCPNSVGMKALERLTRYLMGCLVIKQWFVFQPDVSKLTAFIDTDGAGCVRTRRSTTGGCMRHGRRTLRPWCKTHSFVALSSGDAELYGCVNASAELIGMMSNLQDLGHGSSIGEVMADASAALGVIKRKGAGRFRHFDTSWLWIQDCAADRHPKYCKLDGRDYVADLFTQALDRETTLRHMSGLDNEYVSVSSEGGEESRRQIATCGCKACGDQC